MNDDEGADALHDENIGLLVGLLRLASVINRPMRDGVADPEGLSLNELRIMMALGGEGDAAGHDLAEVMGMQPMNVSRALATLSALTLIEQVDDPANKRRKPYRLSEAGWQRHAAMGPEMAAVADFVFSALKAPQKQALARTLEVLNAQVDRWQPPAPHRHVQRA